MGLVDVIRGARQVRVDDPAARAEFYARVLQAIADDRCEGLPPKFFAQHALEAGREVTGR